MIDIKLINSFIEQNDFKLFVIRLRNSILKRKRKAINYTKAKIINLLKSIGFFEPLYQNYKLLKKLLK